MLPSKLKLLLIEYFQCYFLLSCSIQESTRGSTARCDEHGQRANNKIFNRRSKIRLSAEFCTSQNMLAIREVATETGDVDEDLVMTALRVIESLSKRKQFIIFFVISTLSRGNFRLPWRHRLGITNSSRYHQQDAILWFDYDATLDGSFENYADFFEQHPNWPVYSLDLSLEYYERYNIERYNNQCIYHKVPANMVEWYNERWMNGRWFSVEDKLVAWCGQIARNIHVLPLGSCTRRQDLDVFKA